MRISFSVPTNMCKHELYCFQVTFFFHFVTQRIHLRSFLGRIPCDIYVVKKGPIAHLQSHVTVLSYLCETEKYEHYMGEIVITEEGRLEC